MNAKKALRHSTEEPVSCPFPDDAWSPEFRNSSQTPTTYLPVDWRNRIHLDPPPSGADRDKECALLAKYKSQERTPARIREIKVQAIKDVLAVWPVQQVLCDPDHPVDKPALKILVRALLDDMTAPTFYCKEIFNRGRPWHCCAQDLAPMFQRPDPLYPGHPAYPSGHSTQAHAVAALFAAMRPKLESPLFAAADRVAQNREVAGLHYPSDSEAGKLLAVQLVDLLLAQRPFQAMVTAALQELP